MAPFQPKCHLLQVGSSLQKQYAAHLFTAFIPFSCAVENTPDTAVVDKEQGKSEQSVLVRPRPDPVTALSAHATHRNNPAPATGSHLPAETARHNGLCAPNDPVLKEHSVMPGTSCFVHQETRTPREIQDDGGMSLQNPSKPPKVPQCVAASNLSTSDELPFPTLDGAPPTASSTYIPTTEELPSPTPLTNLPHSECMY